MNASRPLFSLVFTALMMTAASAVAQDRGADATSLVDVRATLEGTPIAVEAHFQTDRFSGGHIRTPRSELTATVNAGGTINDDLSATIDLAPGSDVYSLAGAAIAGVLAVQGGKSPNEVNAVLKGVIPNFVAMQIRSKRSELRPDQKLSPANPDVLDASLLLVAADLQLGKDTSPERSKIAFVFDAAVTALRMKRADYCGTGDTYTVTLTSAGSNPGVVIDVLVKVLGISYDAGKKLVSSTPVVLKEKASKEEAEAIKAQLVEAGATVEVK